MKNWVMLGCAGLVAGFGLGAILDKQIKGRPRLYVVGITTLVVLVTAYVSLRING